MNTPPAPRPAGSIRRRLFTYLGCGLLLLWLLTALGSSFTALHEINEAADSQMSQLARTLMRVPHNTRETPAVADIETLLGHEHGNAESDHHGFAVWNRQGRLLLADRRGRDITFQTASGFRNNGSVWQNGSWRYLYLHDPVSGRTVAVSQSLAERLSILANAVWIQLGLTLLLLPALFWLLAYGIRRGLQPLNALGADLRSRNAHSLQPVSENVPAETLPMVQSLNTLLERVSAAMQRERRFTSDAAHELRSPLAALKIQTEVLAMSRNTEEQQHHLARIQESISRAGRLTEQLLALSRLDPLQNIPDAEPIDWQHTARQALQSVNIQAREKNIRLRFTCTRGGENTLPADGSPVLLQLMLRNLLDNAIRYSPEHSNVTLSIAADGINVCDQGTGIAPEHLERICERFYRPPGQHQQGSGLGLSIVESIAALHNLKMTLENKATGGLCVNLHKAV